MHVIPKVHVLKSASRSLPVRIVVLRCLHRQQHAKEKVEMAHLHGTPIRELSTSRRGEHIGRYGMDADSPAGMKASDSHRSQRWAFLSGSALTRRGGEGGGADSDHERGGQKGGQAMTRSDSHPNLVSECRDRSQAAWLHFPHIELLFLFFAFEGAVASEVAALRDSRCPWVIIAAATALVSPRLCRGYALFCVSAVPLQGLQGVGVFEKNS